jgi:hypothetical protein
MDGEEGQKPNYKETVGGQKRPPTFEQGARRYEQTVGSNSLNEKPQSAWQKAKNWLGGAVAVGAVVGGGVAAAQKIEQNSQDLMFNQPVTGEVQDANLIASSETKTNVSDVNPSAPIFRKSPDANSDEYSKEELQEMGVDVTGNVKVEKVWGKPYASNLQSAQVTDEKSGIIRGVWGEIVAPDPENPGKYKGTGVFLSQNFFSIEKPDTTNSSEGQNINQQSTTSISSSSSQ